MASSANIRSFTSRIRNSRNSVERGKSRFESSANNAGMWWRDDAFPVFQEENQSTIRDTNELIRTMANLQSRFENLAEQLRRAEDERRGERRNR